MSKAYRKPSAADMAANAGTGKVHKIYNINGFTVQRAVIGGWRVSFNDIDIIPNLPTLGKVRKAINKPSIRRIMENA